MYPCQRRDDAGAGVNKRVTERGAPTHQRQPDDEEDGERDQGKSHDAEQSLDRLLADDNEKLRALLHEVIGAQREKAADPE